MGGAGHLHLSPHEESCLIVRIYKMARAQLEERHPPPPDSSLRRAQDRRCSLGMTFAIITTFEATLLQGER